MASEKDASLPTRNSSQFLDPDEKAIVDLQLDVPKVKVGYFSLYRYANKKEIIIIVFSAIAAIVAGAVLPLMTLVFGNFAGSFSNFYSDTSALAHFKHQIKTFTLYFVYLGITSFFSVYFSIVGFSYTGERMTQKIRELYLAAIFRQNIAFFDFLGSGEITTRITADMNLVQDGLSQKVALVITGCATFVSALIVGFVRSWRLSLVMLSATVAILMTMAIFGTRMRKNQTQAVDAFATAGTLAEEVISSARNVNAFGTQKRLEKKHDSFLVIASGFDFKAKAFLGIMIACMMTILNLQFGLAFWQGSRFIHSHELTVSQLLTVTMSMMIAGISIGHILPHIGAFGLAAAAAAKIFNTIERKSPIDPESDSGVKPDKVTGKIEFKNINLVYPSRPDTRILDDFSLLIPAGKMTAIVGASGSGKSTLFGLIERFYLPLAGEVLLDGINISALNLRWLRRNISLVSQEPVLFSTTIYESIAHGLVGTEYENEREDVKTSLIEKAAKIANAYDFITCLPQKFNSRVGERGSLLSGGQKQRIAIARAIVSDPKILLLDEATASLDTKSESAVQKALDQASKGRTTIVIAHRLSTIMNADNIVVMSSGKIVEQGTHHQLLDQKTVYYTLVQAQELMSKVILPGEKGVEGETSGDFSADDEKRNALHLIQSTTSTKHTGTPVKTEKKNYTTWQMVKFAWSLNKSEHRIMIFGFVFATLSGFAYPVQSIFFGNAINALTFPHSSTGEHPINFWSLMFLMLGLSSLIFHACQGTALGFASARLVRRAREQAFQSILRQDMSFFDQDQVTSGSLASFLSIEANRLAGMSGATLAAILNSCATIVGSLAIGISFGWKLALVCASTMPILLACGYWRFRVLSEMEARMKRTTDAATFACEAASSIRTVASLTLEKNLRDEYHVQLDAQAFDNLRYSTFSAILYAFSQSVAMFAIALSFWYGGTLISKQEYTLVQFFICYAAVINGSQSAGAIFSFAPDMGEAKSAAQLLMSLLHRVPLIDSWSTEGHQVERVDGKIELKDVRFTYPARPDQKVLRGVSLTALPGQFIALVGASGSGKSTVMALLERFYDPTSGTILVDDLEIPKYNLQNYRSHMALVSQETTLYTGTIRENILTDKEDASEEAIVQACKDANIYEFIMSLPDGFNTLVGAKGSLLSGGQRQRLAIARALLRDPKILLLDEATSSLDSASEAAVQAALDKAAKGRTTIAIAHRLSTTQHADCLYVFDNGRVVERGRHDELMARKGVYWELGRLQELGV
ncbi:P-loop containing nucleoside triphosphate hydrolase protein [Lepidopterella palustris CBS 459.81]|uniref:P-loop containing nucleoside triphosphate hydrolase protein n=1 Tax=Lepidopterella palustris CBS 459.81 TaxID=1314670 RepID=A0A8E2EG38_9PEZI|nr:P-loop containing nucleoside triphosphate hydrolase protein [Lepidopterella palustris CBS 459.81]